MALWKTDAIPLQTVFGTPPSTHHKSEARDLLGGLERIRSFAGRRDTAGLDPASALQVRELIVTDTHRRQLTESRIDPVDSVTMGHDVVDEFLCLGYAASRLVAEINGNRLVPGLA